VASYVARYALPGSGLSGSMGLVTADIGNAAGISPSAVSPSFAPVRNLRVTDGGEYRADSGSNVYNAGTYRGSAVSVAVSGRYDESAGAYNDGDVGVGHYAVWLSWEGPEAEPGLPPGLSPAISGCVIDFFDATGAITSSSLPIYRVGLSCRPRAARRLWG
jgi:hypothetical protein